MSMLLLNCVCSVIFIVLEIGIQKNSFPITRLLLFFSFSSFIYYSYMRMWIRFVWQWCANIQNIWMSFAEIFDPLFVCWLLYFSFLFHIFGNFFASGQFCSILSNDFAKDSHFIHLFLPFYFDFILVFKFIIVFLFFLPFWLHALGLIFNALTSINLLRTVNPTTTWQSMLQLIFSSVLNFLFFCFAFLFFYSYFIFFFNFLPLFLLFSIRKRG